MPSVPADLVQDVLFGSVFVLAGIAIIRDAVNKHLPDLLASFIAAVSAYAALYL